MTSKTHIEHVAIVYIDIVCLKICSMYPVSFFYDTLS